MREINSVFVHCSATPEGRDVTTAEIDQWHRNRGWDGIGYHKVVRLSGEVEHGRPIYRQGAHARGYNLSSLAVVYIGGVDNAGKPKDTRTRGQYDALFDVVIKWCLEFNIPVRSVFGHNEVDNKACPSFDMDEFRAELTKRIKQKKVKSGSETKRSFIECVKRFSECLSKVA